MKVDVTISRKMTINTGNYSSISPSVSITVKDVHVNKIQEVYEQMDTIVGGLMIFETKELAEPQEIIKQAGLRKYLDYGDSVKEEILKDMREAQGKLKDNYVDFFDK